MYRIKPKSRNRQAEANSVDPDQTPQNVASDQGHTVCQSSSSLADIPTDGTMESFKFEEKYLRS